MVNIYRKEISESVFMISAGSLVINMWDVCFKSMLVEQFDILPMKVQCDHRNSMWFSGNENV